MTSTHHRKAVQSIQYGTHHDNYSATFIFTEDSPAYSERDRPFGHIRAFSAAVRVIGLFVDHRSDRLGGRNGDSRDFTHTCHTVDQAAVSRQAW
jgi:hypothetical protein